MSERGAKFLRQWLTNNMSGIVGANVVTLAEATQKLLSDAKAIGIRSEELKQDNGSTYEAVLDAIVQHRQGQMSREISRRTPT